MLTPETPINTIPDATYQYDRSRFSFKRVNFWIPIFFLRPLSRFPRAAQVSCSWLWPRRPFFRAPSTGEKNRDLGAGRRQRPCSEGPKGEKRPADVIGNAVKV